MDQIHGGTSIVIAMVTRLACLEGLFLISVRYESTASGDDMKPCEKTFSPILWERESRQRSDEERQQIRFRLARMQGKERKGHVTVAVREIESTAESRWCKSHLALRADRAHTIRIALCCYLRRYVDMNLRDLCRAYMGRMDCACSSRSYRQLRRGACTVM